MSAQAYVYRYVEAGHPYEGLYEGRGGHSTADLQMALVTCGKKHGRFERYGSTLKRLPVKIVLAGDGEQ